MKILYIDRGNVTNINHQYQYYGDFYRELQKKFDVTLYEGDVQNVNPNEYNCIIFGLGFFAQTHSQAYKYFENIANAKIPVVCMIHKLMTLVEEKVEFCKVNNIDLLLHPHITYKDHSKQIDGQTMRFWFTADPKLYYPREVAKIYDIGFSGTAHGGDKIPGPTNNLRNSVHSTLLKHNYIMFWNISNSQENRIVSVEEYATKINSCKIWISTTGPVLDVSPRYFEVMMSKTLLFCNNMPYEYEGVFKDGVNCVTFENDLSDLEEKVKYYLDNDAERKKIIDNAYDMAISNYTWSAVTDRVVEKIREIKNDRV